MDAFDRTQLVIVDAPTGSGKTLIGETIGRLLDRPRLYVCSSKMLQNQFVHDFPYSHVLKGRSNYPTQLRERSFPEITCEDCTWSMLKSCNLCETKFDCPYERTKRLALGADVAVVNTPYLLTEANHIGKLSGREFTIVDEADMLESSLMNHVSVEIGERRLERYGWEPPARVTVEDSWVEWLDATIADVRVRYARVGDVSKDVRVAREARYLSQLQSKLADIRDGIPSGNWVYTGRANSDPAHRYGPGVSFRPARVDHLGREYLWRHSNKWLLMSATVISSDEIVESLGWDRDYETIRVPSTFPVENRRVYYRGVVSMAFRNRSDETWRTLADRILRDLADHRGHRVLIHTVSYALTDYLGRLLQKGADRDILWYTNALGKEPTVRKYLDSDNAVLIGPSLTRGLDLPGDACRVQMLTKVPFPNVRDRQINKRMYSRGGRLWYAVQTVRELVQMCGRAVRSDTDWAVTYIYDTDFETNLWGRNRNLFPSWFKEAIIWRERA
jgi:ATP-dependent DNA helicase DinG